MTRSILPITGFALIAGMADRLHGAIAIDQMFVGDAGNAADTRVMDSDHTSGYGSVGYAYWISQNETTVSQYAEFLNAVAATDTYGLYNSGMSMGIVNGITRNGVSGSYTYGVAPGSGNMPVTFVSWFDAARFCNWLQNGQPVGQQNSASTEDGAYTLNGAISGNGITRNVGATIWIPSEDEWYKAAYYDPSKDSGAGGYWLQTNATDLAGDNTVGNIGSLNYFDGDYVGYPGLSLTEVGTYGPGSQSAYGTNDQGGNVFEWNDGVIGSSRGLRGGSWDYTDHYMSSISRGDFEPTEETHNVGFRVAGTFTLARIPEPDAASLIGAAGVLLLARRRR